MSLQQRVTALAQAVGADIKAVRLLIESLKGSDFAPVISALNSGGMGFLMWTHDMRNRLLLREWLDSRWGLAHMGITSGQMTALVAYPYGTRVVSESQKALDYLVQDSALWDIYTAAVTTGRVSIPAMTGFNTPQGVVSASSTNGNYYAWQAFDQTPSIWIPDGEGLVNQWLRYTFAGAVHINRMQVRNGALGHPSRISLQCSTNGSDWPTVFGPVDFNPSTNTQIFNVACAGRYQHWRIYFHSTVGFGSVDEIQLTGFL